MTVAVTPEVGTLAPDFRLKGPEGTYYSLAEFRGNAPVVLAFYPLAFSPVCSHQLPTLETLMPTLRARGVEVFGVSVDSHHSNREFARRLGISFPLLADFDRKASAAWGLLLETGYSGRALFLIDREGRVAWREVTPHPDHVPSNEALLAAVNALGV
ncbi:MAG: redoxin domain-containing protein [Candidatus Eisenbacteria bacterium]|uniref:Redoxin domain-containing protein n=1 Tax=Eiseniibacteriota bacterium TaxID=2212470 RepID=A0A849SKU1_UNCEI|nr:redoxin domain-containing protein [Candidatus Eisenbacteria bacterium]